MTGNPAASARQETARCSPTCASWRRWAAVIGAGPATFRIENSWGARSTPPQRQARQRRGQAEIPPIAVITNSGELDHDAKLFTRTEVPPLILTSADSVADTRG